MVLKAIMIVVILELQTNELFYVKAYLFRGLVLATRGAQFRLQYCAFVN